MAQQERMHAHLLRELTDGVRRGMQRVKDGRRSGRIEYRGIEYQEVRGLGDAAQGRQARGIDVARERHALACVVDTIDDGGSLARVVLVSRGEPARAL